MAASKDYKQAAKYDESLQKTGKTGESEIICGTQTHNSETLKLSGGKQHVVFRIGRGVLVAVTPRTGRHTK